jgi:hypothetical protein
MQNNWSDGREVAHAGSYDVCGEMSVIQTILTTPYFLCGPRPWKWHVVLKQWSAIKECEASKVNSFSI